jgi:uridine kinase
VNQGTRDEVLGRLAEAVGSVTLAHPRRVAIDGPPAAGKTTLAHELAGVLRTQGRDVIRATIDDFLFPPGTTLCTRRVLGRRLLLRHPRLHALSRVLLDPLGRAETAASYAVYDRTADTALSPLVTTAPADAVLVFDGFFLMRPELIDRWDLRVFVSTAPQQGGRTEGGHRPGHHPPSTAI